MNNSPELLEDISSEIRAGALETIENAGHGHVGASSSSVELMTSLYFDDVMDYDAEDPDHPGRDRVLARGHVGPLRYKLFSLLDWVEEGELETYRQYPTKLKGHEHMHEVDGVDITPSGSLGMLLSYGVGSQIAADNMDEDFTTYVFLGDGEEQEGNVGEAARHAATEGYDNLVAVLDQNDKQLSRPTHEVDSSADISQIWEGYGWNVHYLEDGHDIEQISSVLESAENERGPSMVIADTEKGRGVPGNADDPTGYHTSSTADWEDIERAIESIREGIDSEEIKEEVERLAQGIHLGEAEERPELSKPIDLVPREDVDMNPDYAQKDYLLALDEVAGEEDVDFYFMDADWVRKDIAEMAGLDNNIEYHNVGIREQHLLSAAHGLSVTDPSARVMVNLGDFLSYRAADQIFASALGQSNVTVISDTAGLTQSRNGKTHQSAGQPGMIDSMPGATFYETADVKDMFNALNRSLTENDGLDYIRTHSLNSEFLPREWTTTEESDHYVSFEPNEEPDIHLVGSGLVTPGLNEAAEMLEEDGVESRVINVVNHNAVDESINPYFNDESPVFVAYNGSPEFLSGNISKALLNGGINPSQVHEHGFDRGDTGTLDQLLDAYQLDGKGLYQKISEDALVEVN